MIERRATDSLHKTCSNDTSLPAKQRKTSHKEALELKTRQNNCKPGTMSKQNSPFKYVSPMCYSQTSQAKSARCRDRREQVTSTSTPKRSGTCFTMVWIIECRATESLHKTCGNDISLPSKQKKNISQGSIGPYNTRKQLWAGKNQAKISPFNYVRPMCYSQTSEAKNARFRDRREQVIYTSTPKRSGTYFTMVWIIECRATESLHKTCGNDISLPSKQKKNISQGSIGPYNTPKQLWAGKNQAKISPFNYVRPMCYSQTSEAKNARFRDRREQVIYTSTPKRSGTYFTMVWIIECRATDSLHETCGNDISLPSKQRKNISRGSIGPYNTPKQL